MRRIVIPMLVFPILFSTACGSVQPPSERPAERVVEADLVCHTTTGGATPTMGQLSENTELFLLEGGVTALLKRTPGNPVVAVRLYLDGGSRVEEPAQSGITSFAFDTATTGGTSSMSRPQLAAALSAMGSSIGHRVEQDFSTLAMGSLDVYFGPTWALFRQVLGEPVFPEAEVGLIRERHLHAIRSRREDPDTRVVDAARSLLFAGHPYAHEPVGTEESVSALTREDLAGYYYNAFDSSRMLLVIVGDLDRAQVEAVVGDTFAGTPASGTRPPRPEPFAVTGVDLVVESVPLPTNYILGMAAAPAPSDPDYPALRLALSHLSDRLFEEVRTVRNLSYAVSAGVSTRMANYTYLYVTAVDPGATLPVMAAEIDALQQTPLSATDMRDLIAGFTTGYYQGIDSNGAMAAELGWWLLYGGGQQNADEFVRHVQAVTPADIQRVANEYLEGYVFGVVGDPSAVDRGMLQSLFSAGGT